MTMLFAISLVAACQTKVLSDPCDVLVKLEPSPATASYIVKNDRPFAIGTAQHRQRYAKYGCGAK